MKPAPIITYTEILGRAISSIEAEIEAWRIKCEGLQVPPEEKEKMLAASTKELRAKYDALQTLYRYETGTEC